MDTWRKVITKLHKSLVKNVQSYLSYSHQSITLIIFDSNASDDLRYFDNEARIKSQVSKETLNRKDLPHDAATQQPRLYQAAKK